MSENLASYYEIRLMKYLKKVFNRSVLGKPDKCINKILELCTNVLKAKNINPSEWSRLASNSRRLPSGFVEFIQVDHMLETATNALAVLDPEHPAAEILRQGLENHASKISEQQRANASHPREASPYKELLKEIISANISITEKELLKELKKVEGHGVIKELDFDRKIICAYDAADKERLYSMNGLKDHLRKIRDKMI